MKKKNPVIGNVFLLDVPFTKTLRSVSTVEYMLVKRLVLENACMSSSLSNCSLKDGVDIENVAIKMRSQILKKNYGILKQLVSYSV